MPVLAGPVEATAIGNLLIQAKTLGHETGDIRSVVRQSFPVETFAAKDAGAWHGAAKRFEALPWCRNRLAPFPQETLVPITAGKRILTASPGGMAASAI